MNNAVLYYEKNIVDIKYEYTTYLTNLLIPQIYEGLVKLAKSSINITKKYKEMKKNPNTIEIFQELLRNLETLSRHNVELELTRIKEKSGSSEYFDDLVKAVIKSYIILLTYNASGKKCKIVEEKFHERIDVADFIHKCYLECSKVFVNMAELFFSPDKSSKNIIYQIINNSITNSIRTIIPIKLILKEYLKNDYIEENREIKHDELRNKIRKELEQKEKTLEYMKKPLIEDSDDIIINEEPKIKPETKQQIVRQEIRPDVRQEGGDTLDMGASDHAVRNVLNGKGRVIVRKVENKEDIVKNVEENVVENVVKKDEEENNEGEIDIKVSDEGDDEFMKRFS